MASESCANASAPEPVAPSLPRGGVTEVPRRTFPVARPAQRHDPGPPETTARVRSWLAKRLAARTPDARVGPRGRPERGGVRPPVDENRLHGSDISAHDIAAMLPTAEVPGFSAFISLQQTFATGTSIFFFSPARAARDGVRANSPSLPFATSWVTDRATDRSSHSPNLRARFRKRMHENDPAAHTVHPRDERPLRVHQRYRGTPLCVRVRLARESRCDRSA